MAVNDLTNDIIYTGWCLDCDAKFSVLQKGKYAKIATCVKCGAKKTVPIECIKFSEKRIIPNYKTDTKWA